MFKYIEYPVIINEKNNLLKGYSPFTFQLFIFRIIPIEDHIISVFNCVPFVNTFRYIMTVQIVLR